MKKFYECPFCNCIMPYKERGEHICNPYDLDREKERQAMIDEIRREECIKQIKK